MIKYLKFNKNYSLFVLVFCLIGIVVFLGCGKDDKNVTQATLPKSITLGIIDSTYLNASPTGLTVTKVGITNKISWTAPSVTSNLVAYKVYTSGADKQGLFFSSSTMTSFFETTNTTDGYTYSFRVTSIFNFFDTAYNYFTEIESLPSATVLLDR